MVCNRVSFIGQALESIKDQSYPLIEQVVIDGASTDGTLKVLNEFLDDKSLLVSEPDQGIYDALNKGLSLTNGEIIGILHSDDFFADNQVLKDVAEAFSNQSVDAVYGDLAYVNRDNTDRVIRYWHAGEFHPKKLEQGWMPPHPTLFFHRRMLERCGGYDTQYKISADYDLILRYFNQRGFRAAYLPRMIVKMRIGGMSNKSLAKIWQKSLEDFKVLKKNKIGGLGTLIWKNLRKIEQFKFT